MGYNGHATGCGCKSCSQYRRARCLGQRRVRERQRRGESGYGDFPAVLAHLKTLSAVGCAAKWIGRVADVAPETVDDLLAERRHGLYAATADALLSVTVPQVCQIAQNHDTSFLPAVGTARRLQGLAVMGHPLYAVAARADMTAEHAREIANERYITVTGRIAGAVAAVYDELWDMPGASTVGRSRAERKGWMPPLAWDDDTIDDPAAEPQLGEERSRIGAIVENAAELERFGIGWGQIEAQLGVKYQSIERARFRARRGAERAA